MATNYDPTKDKTIWTEKFPTSDKGGIEVSLCQYEEGDPKIQMIRYYVKADATEGFAKLGRCGLAIRSRFGVRESETEGFAKLGRVEMGEFEKICEIVKKHEI